jgi:predicted NUDIX family NTP pyrophosphohydrolase
MPARSAGILLYRVRAEQLEVLLVHPGGPFWVRKDAGAWTIPKGELDGAGDAEACARREFEEETGSPLPDGELVPLGSIRQRAGKEIEAWAVEGDLDADAVVSNTFEVEWPPRSGRRQEFPEVDRAGWFDAAAAREKLNPAQVAFVERLEQHLGFN